MQVDNQKILLGNLFRAPYNVPMQNAHRKNISSLYFYLAI